MFAGTFDLAAAEEVCAGGERSREKIVETLVGLVEKSVLVGVSRTSYRMLDTLRQFGADHLAGTNAEAVAQSRLVAHYLALAQRFGRDPMRDQLAQCRALHREHANLRAAMEYSLDLTGNDSAAVAIATSLAMYWRLSGQLREGEYWLNRVQERCPRPSPARARVLAARGYVVTLLGDLRTAHADAEVALAIAAQFGDMAACGRACVTLHRTLTWGGHPAEAEDMAIAALSFLSSAGDPFGLAQLDIQAAVMHLAAGRPDLVIERCAEGIARLPADEHWATGLLSAAQGLGHLLRGELDAGTVAAHRGLSAGVRAGRPGRHRLRAGDARVPGRGPAPVRADRVADRRLGAAVGAGRPLVHRRARHRVPAPAGRAGRAGQPRRGALLGAARARRGGAAGGDHPARPGRRRSAGRRPPANEALPGARREAGTPPS